MKYIILTLAFAAAQAMATKAPEHCEPRKPDVKTPEVKSPSNPVSKAADRTPSDHDRPCDRQEIKPFWCPMVK